MGDEDYGEPTPYDPNFRGPLEKRSCTDVICLLLFIVFMVCWGVIGFIAFTQGNTAVLLNPKDSNGFICGVDSSVIDKPYLVFFDLSRCINPSVLVSGCPTTQLCVERCPDEFFSINLLNELIYNRSQMICSNGHDPSTLSEAQRLVNDGRCAPWYLPSDSILNRCIPSFPITLNNTALQSIGIDLAALETAIENIRLLSVAGEMKKLSPGWQQWVALLNENDWKSKVVRFPLLPFILLIIFFFQKNYLALDYRVVKDVPKYLLELFCVSQNIISDYSQVWWKILIGLAIAVVTCVIYIAIMRWVAGVMIWFSIFGILALLALSVYISVDNYIYYRDTAVTSSNVFSRYISTKNVWLALTIISSTALVIILLILLVLRSRIKLAIVLVKEASKAVSSVTAALCFPIVPWFLQVGVIFYGVIVGLFLLTVGDPYYVVQNLDDSCTCTGNASSYTNGSHCEPSLFARNCLASDSLSCSSASCQFVRVDSPTHITYFHVINMVCFFWSAFFVSAFSEMVLASTFATWYWTFNKSKVPFFTVTVSLYRTCRYHLGTLAFGSLIITICRIIRVILEYIDYKLKQYDNVVTRAIMCIFKCFFWCLEKFLKFINKNAYIMCAIYGKNFCTSARKAFGLLMRNILRVVVLDKVTDFLFFLSKLLLSAGVGCLAYLYFVRENNIALNYTLVPVLTIAVGTYFIAAIFFSVFTMAVDTIFLCFLEDCERNDGSREKPYFMSKQLMRIFGGKNKLH